MCTCECLANDELNSILVFGNLSTGLALSSVIPIMLMEVRRGGKTVICGKSGTIEKCCMCGSETSYFNKCYAYVCFE